MTEIPQADPVDAADTAFLFEEIGGSRRAISRDLLGAKLPQSPQGWSVTHTFLLAVDHIMPVDLQPVERISLPVQAGRAARLLLTHVVLRTIWEVAALRLSSRLRCSAPGGGTRVILHRFVG